MFYKLSNTAEIKDLEGFFNKPLKYPSLYSKKPLIDGLSEDNLIIITSDAPNHLQIGIWGILPTNYNGTWRSFQNIKNTLNFNTESLKTDSCFGESLYKRRCLIFVTGFFTTYLVDGETYPYYVHLTSGKPFCLAGIYNTLKDGFITCSLIVTNKAEPLQKIQNLSCEMPLMINKSDSLRWLNDKLKKDEVDDILNNPESFLFEVHPVSKKIYINPKEESDILAPVEYKELDRLT